LTPWNAVASAAPADFRQFLVLQRSFIKQRLSSEGEAFVKLESWHSSEDKRRWKIVRTDNYTDIAGEIVTADETTGECSIHVGGETKTLSFGPGGIRIVGRGR
jgi:hypothetical protein